MSGHSKWHNIQKTKGAADAKRAQAFTKIAREMMAPMQMRETCLANQPDRLFGRPCAADVIRCDGKLCHVRCPFLMIVFSI